MTRVFLLIGQSNMAGAARVDDLPEADRLTPDNVRLYEDGEWRPLIWKERFGPEVGIARRLADSLPDQDLVFCKVSRGGTNLYYDWAPDRAEGGPEDAYRGPLHSKLVDSVHAIRSALDEVEFAGAFWAQGARDSVFEFMANAYEENLASFIVRIRSDTRTPDLPFLIARGMPRSVDTDTGKPRHPFKKIVRQAQQAVAARVANVILVEAGDIPQFDALHYDAAGQLELGSRFADSWLSHRAY